MQTDLINNEGELYKNNTQYGPIQSLLDNSEITEILVNSAEEIYFEKHGQLFKHNQRFPNELTYESLLDQIALDLHTFFNQEKPFIEIQKTIFVLQSCTSP